MKTSKILSAGVALFAMLFGAGNVVLSLALGRDSGDMVGYALFGFLIGAVVIPLVGLIAAMLSSGDYKILLGRMGTIPGALIALIGMILIGPFGCIPRCIATSYAAVKPYLSNFSILYFSIIASVIIFLCTIRRSGVINILGRYLGPVKLTLLIAIIVKGIFTAGNLSASAISGSAAVTKGLSQSG
jgi:LIVCS family branched-chain amino acid:cation transporter